MILIIATILVILGIAGNVIYKYPKYPSRLAKYPNTSYGEVGYKEQREKYEKDQEEDKKAHDQYELDVKKNNRYATYSSAIMSLGLVLGFIGTTIKVRERKITENNTYDWVIQANGNKYISDEKPRDASGFGSAAWEFVDKNTGAEVTAHNIEWTKIKQ